METVRYFGYSIPIDKIHPAAGMSATDFNDLFVGSTKARNIIYSAGLGGKASTHIYSKKDVRYVFFVLASSKWDGYAPCMPRKAPLAPEEYQTLREILQTEELGRWRKFKL